MIGSVISTASCRTVAHHDHICTAVFCQKHFAKAVIRFDPQRIHDTVRRIEMLFAGDCIHRLNPVLYRLNPLSANKCYIQILQLIQ